MPAELVPDTLMAYLNSMEGQNSPVILHNPEGFIKKAFGDINFKSPFAPVVFVSDLTKKGFIYVNKGIESLIGYSDRYITEGKFECFYEKFNDNDFKLVNENIFKQNLKVMGSASPEEMLNYVFSHNYRIKNKNGKYLTLLQRFSMVLSRDKKFIGAIGSFSDISHFSKDNQMFHQIEHISGSETGNENNIIYHKTFFRNPEDACLSKRELEVLKWMSEGYISKQIADKLNISLNTVNNHRKKMLQKTNCRTSAELLSHAHENGIL